MHPKGVKYGTNQLKAEKVAIVQTSVIKGNSPQRCHRV